MIKIGRHLEDTDSERTTLASKESEHTTKAATKHTSQPASNPSTPPSTIPNNRRTLIHPIDEKAKIIDDIHWRRILYATFLQKKKGAKLLTYHLREVRVGLADENKMLLTYHLREVRVGLADENKIKPHRIADDLLNDLVRIWESEDFKKLSKKNKSNRNSNSGGLDTLNELRQAQTDASDAELWLEATGGVKWGGYVYGFRSDT
nr:putative transposase En/Spm [Ipomoea trifida]